MSLTKDFQTLWRREVKSERESSGNNGKEENPMASITINPHVRGGVPCVGPDRPITHILQELAMNASVESTIQSHPDLTLADIQLALKAAAWVMRDVAIAWEQLRLPEMVDWQDELRAWESLSA